MSTLTEFFEEVLNPLFKQREKMAMPDLLELLSQYHRVVLALVQMTEVNAKPHLDFAVWVSLRSSFALGATYAEAKSAVVAVIDQLNEALDKGGKMSEHMSLQDEHGTHLLPPIIRESFANTPAKDSLN